MKETTIYAVIQKYYDNGKIKASMISSPSEKVPDQVYVEKRDHDLYIDYFTSKADAESFLQDCFRA